jgi:hypothetical protein
MDGDYTSWIAAMAATVLMLSAGRFKRMFEPKRRWMRCASCGRHLLRGSRCACLDD